MGLDESIAHTYSHNIEQGTYSRTQLGALMVVNMMKMDFFPQKPTAGHQHFVLPPSLQRSHWDPGFWQGVTSRDIQAGAYCSQES